MRCMRIFPDGAPSGGVNRSWGAKAAAAGTLVAAAALGVCAAAALTSAPSPSSLACRGLQDEGGVVRDAAGTAVRGVLSRSQGPVLVVVDPPRVTPSQSEPTQLRADELAARCFPKATDAGVVVVIRAADGSAAAGAGPLSRARVSSGWPGASAATSPLLAAGRVSEATAQLADSAVTWAGPGPLPARAAAAASGSPLLVAGAGVAGLALAVGAIAVAARLRRGRQPGREDAATANARDLLATRADQMGLAMSHLQARLSAPVGADWSQAAAALVDAELFATALADADLRWLDLHATRVCRQIIAL